MRVVLVGDKTSAMEVIFVDNYLHVVLIVWLLACLARRYSSLADSIPTYGVESIIIIMIIIIKSDKTLVLNFKP